MRRPGCRSCGVMESSAVPFRRVILVFKRHYLCNNYTLSYDIWLSVRTFGRMCGTSDPGSCIR
jgi:hypothetical protein